MRWVGVGVLGAAVPLWAGRPLVVNDTEPVAVGDVQIEISTGYHKDSGRRHFEYPVTVASGLFSGVDLGAGFGGQFEQRTETAGGGDHDSGLCDLVVYPRWKILEESARYPSQALCATVKFPTADRDQDLGSGAVDYDLTWIASKRLTKKVQVDANMGYSLIGRHEDEVEPVFDIIHYGAALSYQVTAGWQGVSEVFAQRDTADGADTTVQYNAGVRRQVSAAVMADAAMGAVIAGEAPNFMVTVGLTWVFGVGSRAEGT